MQISIIIPTLNEAANISNLIQHLDQHRMNAVKEIIVVDGGSTDKTRSLAKKAGATVYQAPKKGRALQMNFGVHQSTGDILYFVHGDTLPPTTYTQDIAQALKDNYPIGCFRFRFDSTKPLLKINSYFTRFDRDWCRGGDQTLFIKRTLFRELNGYKEDFMIMEEYDLIKRARLKYPFKIIPKEVLVSARKYHENGYLKVQVANLVVFNMYRLGYSQQKLVKTYRRMLQGLR